MDISKLEATLTSLGLWKAIKGYPALLALIIISVASLELIAPQALLLLPGLSASSLHLFISNHRHAFRFNWILRRGFLGQPFL